MFGVAVLKTSPSRPSIAYTIESFAAIVFSLDSPSSGEISSPVEWWTKFGFSTGALPFYYLVFLVPALCTFDLFIDPGIKGGFPCSVNWSCVRPAVVED